MDEVMKMLPENSQTVEIEYEPAQRGVRNSISWTISMKRAEDFGSAGYGKKIEFTEKELQNLPMDVLIGEVESAIHRVIEEYITEEIFAEHVDGPQKMESNKKEPSLKGATFGESIHESQKSQDLNIQNAYTNYDK